LKITAVENAIKDDNTGPKNSKYITKELKLIIRPNAPIIAKIESFVVIISFTVEII